jgi:aspartate racemase
MKEKVIGILGGLGPEATLELYRRILIHTPARVDQEHLHVIIDCNPKIPDPNDAVMLPGAPSSVPALCDTARNLERSGADFIIIPCNTAHIFLPQVRAAVRIPVLSMVDEVVSELRRRLPGVQRAGLLASPAVVTTGLYARALAGAGLETVIPDAAGQKTVYKVIFKVKAGDKSAAVRACLDEVAQELARKGAQAVLLACTELPLVTGPHDLALPALDTVDILARAAVRLARQSPD